MISIVSDGDRLRFVVQLGIGVGIGFIGVALIVNLPYILARVLVSVSLITLYCLFVTIVSAFTFTFAIRLLLL